MDRKSKRRGNYYEARKRFEQEYWADLLIQGTVLKVDRKAAARMSGLHHSTIARVLTQPMIQNVGLQTKGKISSWEVIALCKAHLIESVSTIQMARISGLCRQEVYEKLKSAGIKLPKPKPSPSKFNRWLTSRRASI